MKKAMLPLCLAALALLMLAGCACKHSWKAATCVDPEICEKCGLTQGEPLGHDWQEATCTLPRTCERCGMTEGEALGHDYAAATCTEPETCLVCGVTKGEALGHDWQDATCTEPKTCARCGETEGDALGHDVEEWETVSAEDCGNDGLRTGVCLTCGETVEEVLPATGEHSWDGGTTTTEATCTEDGVMTYTCTVCGDTYDEAIPATGHTESDWIIVTPATSTEDGTREIQCTVCGETLKTERYEMTDEEKAQAFRDECTTYSYEEIARNPADYYMEKVHFRGEVIQVLEDGDDVTLRVNVTQGSYVWSDTIMVYYTRQDSSEGRILEDDIIDLYGYSMETITYESVMGADITIPLIYAQYIDIN